MTIRHKDKVEVRTVNYRTKKVTVDQLAEVLVGVFADGTERTETSLILKIRHDLGVTVSEVNLTAALSKLVQDGRVAVRLGLRRGTSRRRCRHYSAAVEKTEERA